MKLPFALPTYQANWWPVYLEPIPGSGERLTVAVIVNGNDGVRQVRSVLPISAFRMLYGDHAMGMMAVVVQTLERIQSQMNQRTAISRLKLPYGGVHIGAKRDSLADDINGVFDQAVRLTSSLGITTFGEATDSSDVQKAFAEWAARIRNVVISDHRYAAWNERFEHNVKLGTRKARINFIAGQYVANFGVLRPQTPADMRALKIKIFDLERYRRHHPLLPLDIEVLIGVPSREGNSLSPKAAQSIADNFDYVHSEGEARKIKVLKFTSPESVARHLQKVAA